MSCGYQPLYSVGQESDFGERGSCFFLCYIRMITYPVKKTI